MDTRIDEDTVTSRRPVRTKRYARRVYGEDKRPPKRLFTPEIKRFLKDWLVRRRENPYPNRDEKKTLAVQTGLSYIQVCNWFANWRRKLKNAGSEPQRRTWGDLIKSYNSQVQGNVEHFSICSDDSIWGDDEDEEEEEIMPQKPTYKYLNDVADERTATITKWLESAANFRPNADSYLGWTLRIASKRKEERPHGRRELDAAEALTRLAAVNRA